MRSGDVLVGRYQLLTKIGKGGMGEVWRATDIELRREVAVKRANSGDGDETRREARIGAGLHHPNVVAVFDVVEDGDARWLVMEYLPARNLAETIREDGPVTPSHAAHIGAQIANALSAIHDRGMVHRDITPSNILVADDGTAKLVDLGIAVWAEVTLTGSAVSAGTPGFLAPEVRDGHGASPASDVYALGRTLAAATEGSPGPRAAFAAALAKLTHPDPDRRPTALKAATLLSNVDAGRSRWRVSRSVLTAVGLGVVVAVVATVVVVVSRPDGTADGTAGRATGGPAPRREVPNAPADGEPSLLYGMGSQADSALATELVRDTPTRMLSTSYYKEKDLSTFTDWRDDLIADSYDKGYALHLVVANFEDDDPEVLVNTKYGTGCGRSLPLSDEYLGYMRTLARIFAGRADGPPLYVTMFSEINTYSCGDAGYFDANPASAAYFSALQDRYLEIRDIFHAEAPNVEVGLGWQAWQAGFDEPDVGGGRSMFERFGDALRASDFQSIVTWEKDQNDSRLRTAIHALGQYGPVMVGVYGNNSIPGETVDNDLRELFSDESLAELTGDGLFAWNFNGDGPLTRAGKPTYEFVKDVVDRTGREP